MARRRRRSTAGTTGTRHGDRQRDLPARPVTHRARADGADGADRADHAAADRADRAAGADGGADVAAGPAGPAGGGDAAAAQEELVVGERVVARQCAGCDTVITPRRRGRPATWCSHACRQRGYARRAAAAELGRPELAEPRVVREVVERTETRTRTVAVPAPPSRPGPPVPERARQWTALLDELLVQLQDPTSRTSRDHDQHRRLYHSLGQAVVALDRAHPGGLRRR